MRYNKYCDTWGHCRIVIVGAGGIVTAVAVTDSCVGWCHCDCIGNVWIQMKEKKKRRFVWSTITRTMRMLEMLVCDTHGAYIDTSNEWNQVKVACVIYECVRVFNAYVCVAVCKRVHICSAAHAVSEKVFIFFTMRTIHLLRLRIFLMSYRQLDSS